MNELIFYPYLKQVKVLAAKRKVGAFLVGGFLRDLLLNRNSFDLDFAIEHDAIPFAKIFSKIIKGVFILLDEEHGCARVAKKAEGKIFTFDFADFRDHSLQEDLQKRDFTINTIAVDLKKWKGRDLLSSVEDNLLAREHLDHKIIRMTSPLAFKQDPLRLLRGFAMRAVLNFSIDKETIQQIKQDCALIRNVSAERIREELFKILETEKASDVLKEMDQIGLLEMVIPHIRIMFDVHQGSYHHLDVWPHSLESVKQMDRLIKESMKDPEFAEYLNETLSGNRTRKALLKLACLLHDIGKPQTRRRDGDRIRFHGHEHAGRVIANAVSKHLKLSTKERHLLGDMVEMHLRPGYLSNFKQPSDKAFFRYFRDTKEEAASIALLAMADQRSTKGPLTTEEDAAYHDQVCRQLIERFFIHRHDEPFIPLITGNDLIKTLGLKPSPLFSKILTEVEEAQASGKVKTKDQALDLARKLSIEKKC